MVEFLARPIRFPILCRDPNQVTYSEVDPSATAVSLTSLASLRLFDVQPSTAPSVVHPLLLLGGRHPGSTILLQRSIYFLVWSNRKICKARIRIRPGRSQPGKVMGERSVCKVHYRERFRPVVLIVVNEGAESLVDILVHNFSLAIGLWVKCRR